MTSVFEINAQEYNLKLAEALKKIPEFKEPDWAKLVKFGVSKLRTKYGSKKNRGFKPEEFRKAGGKIIRTILQQSDKAGFTEIAKDIRDVRSKKPGRQLTKKGKDFLEAIK